MLKCKNRSILFAVFSLLLMTSFLVASRNVFAEELSKWDLVMFESNTKSFYYTGEEIRPTVTSVHHNTFMLKEGKDYYVEYKDNVNAGTATVIIHGMGNYTGVKEQPFWILPLDISGSVVELSEDWVYTGEEIKPPVKKVTFYKNDVVLKEDEDYYVEYKDNVDAGEATVIIYGKGNYTGEDETSFRILPASLAGATVSIKEELLDTYTYEDLKRAVTVTLGGKTLYDPTDYIIAEHDNERGKVTVKIEGTGNYTGTAKGSGKVIRTYGLYVGGILVTAANASNIKGEGISGKVSYDASSKTLYLTNATISKDYVVSSGSKYTGSHYYSLYTASKLNIRLSGKNTLCSGVDLGTTTISGKGSLSISAFPGGLLVQDCVTCNSLSIAKDSSVSISCSGAYYGNTAAQINGNLDLQGTLKVYADGIPATGIVFKNGNISGTLKAEVKCIYTNYSKGVSANSLTISGKVIIDSSKAKSDDGLKCSSLTITNTGILEVNSTVTAINTAKYKFGKKLVLRAGSSKSEAFKCTPGQDALKKSYVRISPEKASADSDKEKDTEKSVKKGVVYTLSGLKYKVTVADLTGKGTVTLTGSSKKTIKTLTVPEKVKISGAYFKVTAIEKDAFKNYKNLNTITAGNNVKTIGSGAFSGDTALTKVTLGTGLTTIGAASFDGDEKLGTLTIKSLKLSSVGKNAIRGIKAKAKIIVPKAALKNYKNLFTKKTGFKTTMTITEYTE